MSPPPWTLFCPRSGLTPGAPAPDVAGEQGEVDQRAHVVHRVVVLGDAQRPADHGAVGAGVGVGHLADHSAGTPVTASARSSVQGSTLLAERLEAAGGVLDEAAVLEAGGEDLARHGVGERDVGAHVERQMPPSAHWADDVRRGSTAYIRAPLWSALST